MDEELHERFLGQPVETLAALRDDGFELTTSEIDALLLTDRRFVEPLTYPLKRIPSPRAMGS